MNPVLLRIHIKSLQQFLVEFLASPLLTCGGAVIQNARSIVEVAKEWIGRSTDPLVPMPLGPGKRKDPR